MDLALVQRSLGVLLAILIRILGQAVLFAAGGLIAYGGMAWGTGEPRVPFVILYLLFGFAGGAWIGLTSAASQQVFIFSKLASETLRPAVRKLIDSIPDGKQIPLAEARTLVQTELTGFLPKPVRFLARRFEAAMIGELRRTLTDALDQEEREGRQEIGSTFLLNAAERAAPDLVAREFSARWKLAAHIGMAVVIVVWLVPLILTVY